MPAHCWDKVWEIQGFLKLLNVDHLAFTHDDFEQALALTRSEKLVKIMKSKNNSHILLQMLKRMFHL